ncbi:MAG: valine--tRNA ligase [bacterium]|nr:valine--tRNA ligase [bacterium]
MKEIPSQYNGSEHEDSIYKMWENSGAFSPDRVNSSESIVRSKRTKNSELKTKNFSIVMPPPNANGSLHLGHALYTLQDIMVRYHRMRGDKTLWLPGADHAGFETQVVYQKKLEKENRNWFHIPREDLYKEILNFTLENKKIMEGQLKKLGFSCDWSRDTFTLDKKIIKTVYATFKRLYDDGLVYRDNRIVNWCTKHQTTLSDLEIKHVERQDPLYYIHYGPITLATVRPETKFGDTALAVHPKDKRYKNLIGKELEIKTLLGPITINVVADEAVDPKFGTGAVKVTPAHDTNDFEIWKRHEGEMRGPKSVIDQYGRMDLIQWWPDNERAKKYHGMKIGEARKVISEDMQAEGLIEKIDEGYIHNVATCYKCGSVVEPRILPQWYVAMTKAPSPGLRPPSPRGRGKGEGKSLRDAAVEAVKKGKVKFTPKRMEKTFMYWMNNLRDWNISRQIVWGIRIPAWYKGKHIHVGETPPEEEGWIQDPDVFDTWFSSGQWPFATLNYPDGQDFKDFYPTSVMETGWDILFFWVARMTMLGLYVTGKVPFENVYLHGLVRDKDRQKMSKSKGNVIDPLGVIDLYGADALRMALIVGNTPGNDIIISEEKIKGYRNFANKIWNASRFVLMNLDEGMTIENVARDFMSRKSGTQGAALRPEDKKILKELQGIAKTVTRHIDRFEFHLAAETIYHYFWHTFADQIIEAQKNRLQGTERVTAQYILLTCLTTSLKLLHPFMPFVTEAVWQQIPKENKSMLITESWPL